MANKNKKHLNLAKNKALRTKQTEVVEIRPVKDYHSSLLKPPFFEVKHPIHLIDKEGIISASEKRNTCMRVLRNTGDSSTWHTSLNPNIPIIHKNHQYIETYRQDTKFGGKI